jgi:hypothetical protein
MLMNIHIDENLFLSSWGNIMVFFSEWVRHCELKVSDVGPTRCDESDM